MFDLSDKVAIITGGNGGIGLGMGRGLVEAGATVVIAARNAEKSAAAVEDLTSRGGEAYALACDVTDENSIANVVQQTLERSGQIDILINNAGMNIRKSPEDYTFDEYRQVMHTNLDSVFLFSQACYPHMKAAGGGKIINNGSMLSIFGSSWSAPYATSKGGMIQLTQSLAAAWAPDNIQVNCFLPGWIDTAMTRASRGEVDGLNEKVLERTPANRWGHIDDFKGIAVFLASSASDFITGTSIPVDGGFSINVL